jgi:outer membrane lipoprotein-sorting protein
MKRSHVALLLAAAVSLVTAPIRADEAQVKQILDKAIQALGGEEKLSKAEAFTWKSKVKLTIEGNQNEMSTEGTAQGPDHFRSIFEGEFNGNKVKGLAVLNGDKGWRKVGDQNMDMDPDAVKNEKRAVYLMVVPATIVPLKSKAFKVETAPDEAVKGKPAAVLKVTGPDGKDFTLFFDKESGLPVRLVAKVTGWRGEEYLQDTTFSDYKDFGGFKKAAKTSIKRDGEDFLEGEVTEFKVLDKVPADTFAEPK